MNGIRSVTSEISVWKEEEEEEEESTAIKHNGFSSTNVEVSHNYCQIQAIPYYYIQNLPEYSPGRQH